MNEQSKIKVPQMILLSGNGRNSGKTLFARQLITTFSKQVPVTAIKISSHFHTVNPENIVLKNEKFTLCFEQETTTKDSSLMLQAGADNVYFLMVKQEDLLEAFKSMLYLLTPSLLICESDGLQQIVEPGILFFVMQKGSKIIKQQHITPNTIKVERLEDSFDYNISSLQINPKTCIVEQS
jgi:hypothetical protein